MENISIEKTNKTPEVLFDFENNYLEIKGISIPEDSESFYRPLMEWIEEYITHLVLEVQEASISEEEETEETASEANPVQKDSIIVTPNITISLKLIYFNTSTADYLVNILRKLREAQPDYPEIMDNGLFNPDDAPKHWVTVEWCYETEDEDMLDTGTHFESVLEMPFTYIAIDEIV